MPEIWTNIDVAFEVTEKMNFTENHLKQLWQSGNVEPQVVQTSLKHLVFDLEHNHFDHDKCKTTPLNMIMGMLRKGIPYLSSHYKSPQLLAQEMLNQRLEKEKEQFEKTVKEAQKMAYEKWVALLSPSDKEKLRLPSGQLIGSDASEHDLKRYFRLYVWPTIKADHIANV